MKDNFQYYRPITVGELIKVLGKYPKDMRVTMSSDGEGVRPDRVWREVEKMFVNKH